MTKAEIYSKILEVSEKSYYRWKSKDHPILIKLIEKYFTDEDLEEFLNTKSIKKFDEIADLKLLNKTIIKIYNNFVNKLYESNLKTLKLFLSIIHKSIEKKIDISLNFIELIIDEKEEKIYIIQLLKEFHNIQDTTLFFYSIKYMVQNKFKDVSYSNKNNDYNYFSEINFKIYHIQQYLEIFLKQKYFNFNEYIESNKINLFNLNDEEFDNYDLRELNALSKYYSYLYSLVDLSTIDTTQNIRNEKNININSITKEDYEYFLPIDFNES